MQSRMRTLFLAEAAIVCLCGQSIQGQCTPQWADEFHLAGVNRQVRTLLTFDADQGGPAPSILFVAGEFEVAGNAVAVDAAQWDGTSWSTMGSGFNHVVDGLAAFDDDGPGPNATAIYAVGQFTMVGATAANFVARWDGTEWSPVGGGFDSYAHVLAVFDDDGEGPNLPALYAAGQFDTAGGTPASSIARWDGRSWTALGGGLGPGPVYALTSWDIDGDGPAEPVLVAGGRFAEADGNPVNQIAAWDGSTWSALGSGVAGPVPVSVNALIAHDEDGAGPGIPILFVGGSFNTAGGNPALNVARYDGTSWQALGAGFSSDVFCLAVFDPDDAGPLAASLFAGGAFTMSGPTQCRRISRWNGAAWTDVGGGLTEGLSVSSLAAGRTATNQPILFVGGQFFDVAGGISIDQVGTWDGQQWSTVGQRTTITGSAQAMVADPDEANPPSLYVAGGFDSAGNVWVNGVTRWDGSTWHPVGEGFNVIVEALAFFDEDGDGPAPQRLFAGGSFTQSGAQSINRVARLVGSTWLPLGTGANSIVYSMTGYNSDGSGTLPSGLYIGGMFWNVGGVGASRVARWTGSSWTALGPGVGGNVYTMVVFDYDGPGPANPALYVAGDLSMARWDGLSWLTLPGGAIGTVSQLMVFDEDGDGPQLPQLCACGEFQIIGGISAKRIARWNGATWTAFGDGFNNTVHAMASVDPDGSGPQPPALYAGGSFTASGPVPINRVARWNGSSWEPLGDGVNGTVGVLAGRAGSKEQPAALFASGAFASAGGHASTNFARWSCADVEPCAADIAPAGGDGTVNIGDLLAVIAGWGACDQCNADVNNDDVVNITDLLLIIASWGECK